MSVNQRQHQCQRLWSGHGYRICYECERTLVYNRTDLHGYGLHGLRTLSQYDDGLCEQHNECYD